jgi:Protein of unknown function (DUF3237)
MDDLLTQHGVVPKLEFAFAVQITLMPALWPQEMPRGGKRVFVGIESGVFAGPDIKGTVISGSGGDYADARKDGVLDFDARYMLREDDGTYIYLQNRGFRWGSEDVMARQKRQEPVDASEYYMRVSPKFEVEAGKHDWLNKYVFIGIGDKVPRGNIIRYFKVL